MTFMFKTEPIRTAITPTFGTRGTQFFFFEAIQKKVGIFKFGLVLLGLLYCC
jgi:hypothetical protein